MLISRKNAYFFLTRINGKWHISLSFPSSSSLIFKRNKEVFSWKQSYNGRAGGTGEGGSLCKLFITSQYIGSSSNSPNCSNLHHNCLVTHPARVPPSYWSRTAHCSKNGENRTISCKIVVTLHFKGHDFLKFHTFSFIWEHCVFIISPSSRNSTEKKPHFIIPQAMHCLVTDQTSNK